MGRIASANERDEVENVSEARRWFGFADVELSAFGDLPKFISRLWVTVVSLLTIQASIYCVAGFSYRAAFLDVFGKPLTSDDFSVSRTFITGLYAYGYHEASASAGAASVLFAASLFMAVTLVFVLVAILFGSAPWIRNIALL
jgi:hypothetical protein